jgi:hypothetical protein
MSSKEDQCLLKEWSRLDPPSNEEIARNDYIASAQANRNPFIDHPEWVDLINFNTMTKSRTSCDAVGIYNPTVSIATNVYPLPAITSVNIDFSIDKTVDLTYNIQDINGHLISTSTSKTMAGDNHKEINTAKLSAGVYMLIINGSGYSAIQKIVIQ